ncbi:unnamed protein product [Brachionus calyciflorus]|uniref:Reverse transcriptase domain-containing protein n=1 Tax=Brachionus calyciflorus TaxID=104777 RepID=A0A814GN82_9BILA|nr:unnamed protein product [Brachionus calyciflorus]
MEESVNAQMKEFKRTTEKEDSVDKLEVNKLGKSSGSSSGSGSKETKFSGKTTSSSYGNNSKGKETSTDSKKCFKCGNDYPHEKICPAKGKVCHKCKKTGSGKRHVRKVEEESDSGSSSSFGNVWRIRLKSRIMAIKDWLMPMVTLFFCGLYAYGQEDCIDTIGRYKTRIKYNNQYKSVEFVVTKGNYGNLLSYKTCVELGIMAKINTVNGTIKDPVKENFIRKYPTPWVSPIVPVPKPDRPNEVRICTAFVHIWVYINIKEQVLSGLDVAMNFSDDIIVFVSKKAEHDARLVAVLKRLNESGLTLNESKYKGILIDSSKFDALLKAKTPATVGEIRSLLGLANYCSRFIPDYASVVESIFLKL